MAFRLYSTDDGHIPAWEYHAVANMKPQVGKGLAFDESGQLDASQTPDYICMREEGDSVAAGTIVPVVKITPDQIWETTLDGATSVEVGGKLDVASGGMEPDGDGTTYQNFLVTYMEDDADGSTVRGRFVAPVPEEEDDSLGS